MAIICKQKKNMKLEANMSERMRIGSASLYKFLELVIR